MGLDVEMYAWLDEEPRAEDLEVFAELMDTRLGIPFGEENRRREFGDYWHVRHRGSFWTVELYTLDRYWAPGYERGPWPDIYARWRVFASVWSKVFYHSDSLMVGEMPQAFTEKDAQEHWAHWLSLDGDQYFARSRARNEAALAAWRGSNG